MMIARTHVGTTDFQIVESHQVYFQRTLNLLARNYEQNSITIMKSIVFRWQSISNTIFVPISNKYF